MWSLLFVLSVMLSFFVDDCHSFITENNPDEHLLEAFAIELTSVAVQAPSEGSLRITVQFQSLSDVTIVWFVDRDMPIIGGDKNFIPFITKLKPYYIAQLVTTLNHKILKTKDIRLQLTANGTSLVIEINTNKIHEVTKQTFGHMNYEKVVRNNGRILRIPAPFFDIESNIKSDKVMFYPMFRRIDSYGGGGVMSYSKIDLTDRMPTPTYGDVMKDPKYEVAMTYLQVTYNDGLVRNLLLGTQINPSGTPSALPDGTFEFLERSIYYKDLKTGGNVEGKLYRCSALGNVKLQVFIENEVTYTKGTDDEVTYTNGTDNEVTYINGTDNEVTYTNGTDLPFIYVENGFEKDLYVVKRSNESNTADVFCQAFYRYKDSKNLSETTHQMPPRYRPWYNLVDSYPSRHEGR